MRDKVIILLHEIYGINQFIEDQAKWLKALGYEVLIPDLLNGLSFSYDERRKAYNYFKKEVGFDSYIKINELASQLVADYEKVYVLGFSVGATLAWRCCENSSISGIIGCYGSRIRDYEDLVPHCPTLLILSKDEGFGNHLIGEKLTIKKMRAGHGFIDKYSRNYDETAAKECQTLILSFLSSYR